jgi:ribosomal protein S18 acetylase RimI-like enzyme
MIRIVPAASKEQIQTARSLFVEYASSLNFDLCCFQNFDQELEGLPGEYASPTGFLLLAICDGETAGCVALRRLAVDTCEMKRLYACPAFRGRGIGRKLAEAVIGRGVMAGYQRMRLDTVDSMKEALSLYDSLGFREICCRQVAYGDYGDYGAMPHHLLYTSGKLRLPAVSLVEENSGCRQGSRVSSLGTQ